MIYLETQALTLKLFADDTSLFPVVDDIGESASKLNNDLISLRMQELAYQWKMSFNPLVPDMYA